ncbi:MAG TPA: glycosyltransferase family 2 protein [bacterium]|nr:glycosyltransferase family 2 protein [bacterium]
MAAKKPHLLSIIVPVYNEEKTLLQLLKKVQAVKLFGLKKQIVLVNDGSTDGTPKILRKLKIPGGMILHHEVNKGKGAAIRTAIPHTKGDIVIIQDADLEYDPNDYKIVLAPIMDGSADVVYGSRFKGVHRAFMFLHYVGNKVLTLLTNMLYDTVLTDMETCYKAFKGDILRSLKLRSNRFDFEPEVTAKVLKRGCKLFEVPISYHGRGFEEGKKITWRDGVVAVYCLIRYRLMD